MVAVGNSKTLFPLSERKTPSLTFGCSSSSNNNNSSISSISSSSGSSITKTASAAAAVFWTPKKIPQLGEITTTVKNYPSLVTWLAIAIAAVITARSLNKPKTLLRVVLVV